MSDINSQSQNNLIPLIKEKSIGTKASLENINKILQDLHKNILKESSSKNMIKSLQSNEKEEKEQNSKNKDSIEDKYKNNNSKVVKEDKKMENKDEENNIDENSDTSDKISNININKIKHGDEYKHSMDINVISSVGIKRKKNKINNKINKKEENLKISNVINNDNSLNEINEDKIEDKNDDKKDDKMNDKNNNIEDKKNKNKEYEYKEYSEITESNIIQEDLNSYNIDKGSEFYLNEIINKLGGPEESSSIKDEYFINIEKDNENKIKEKENNSDSEKIDSTEDIKLRLTNIPLSEEKDNTSLITNELNKACIKTKDCISNLSSDIPHENEKDSAGKSGNQKLNKINSKNSDNDKKNGFEMFLKKESNKDENVIIEETKKEIYNEIKKMYENKLNLVKINNKEKFSYITKYNDPDKDKLGYEPDYFYRSKNSINFLNRRNNFLEHKYFSYILSKKEKKNNLEEKSNKINDKKKDDSIDSINNNAYNEEEINKFKKNYNEQFEPMTLNLNYIRANTQHDNIKEYRIYDIEDMASFYYYFNLYSPEESFKNVLDDENEKEILNSFTAYRKILNDGNSFKRAFSYLLLENFILQNKSKKLDFIIYDIKRMLSKKFKDIKQICNLLIDIKENSSIDYLMDSYNNPSLNFDEVMVAYIEDNIKNVIGIDKSKRKYQEIDFNIQRILCNIFDINLEVYYLEEDEDNNEYLKMQKIIIYNDNFLRAKENIKSSSSSECESSITFRLLYFLNSFYIVYTKKSDIDSTLANNNNEKQYYYIPSLPKYKCPTCKKLTGLDIIPLYEAIFCHICLNKHLQEILEKRAILFVKSNFSCIEYYTRPIKITSDIIITFSLYKYITNNYITRDFEKIVGKICFKCFEKYEKEKINKLKCMCQLCDNCLEKLLKENIKKKVCLNKYELNTISRTKCLCENEVDLVNLMELSKNKPTEKDKKDAEERLLKVIKKRCCLCKEKDPLKIFEFKIVDGPPHFMCINCHEKELKNEEIIQNVENNKNEIKNDFDINEYESNDTAIKEKNVIKKKFFCKICFEDHISVEDTETEHQNFIGRVVKYGEGKFRCCKGKCSIF